MKTQLSKSLLALLCALFTCSVSFGQRAIVSQEGYLAGPRITLFGEHVQSRSLFSLAMEFDLSGETISQGPMRQLFKLNPSSTFEFSIGGNHIEMVGPLYAQLHDNFVSNEGIAADYILIHGGELSWLDGHGTGQVLLNGQPVTDGYASISFYDSTQTMLRSTELSDFSMARDSSSLRFRNNTDASLNSALLIGTTTVSVIPEPTSPISLALFASGVFLCRKRKS